MASPLPKTRYQQINPTSTLPPHPPGGEDGAQTRLSLRVGPPGFPSGTLEIPSLSKRSPCPASPQPPKSSLVTAICFSNTAFLLSNLPSCHSAVRRVFLQTTSRVFREDGGGGCREVAEARSAGGREQPCCAPAQHPGEVSTIRSCHLGDQRAGPAQSWWHLEGRKGRSLKKAHS